MSEKLPRVTANEIINLHPKVVKSILVDAGLSVEEFKKMMKK